MPGDALPTPLGVADLAGFERGLKEIDTHNERMRWAAMVAKALLQKGERRMLCDLVDTSSWCGVYGVVLAKTMKDEEVLLQLVRTHSSFHVRCRAVAAVGDVSQSLLLQLMKEPLPLQLKPLILAKLRVVDDDACQLIVEAPWGGAEKLLDLLLRSHHKGDALCERWVKKLCQYRQGLASRLQPLVARDPELLMRMLEDNPCDELLQLVPSLCQIHGQQMRALLRCTQVESLINAVIRGHPKRGGTELLQVVIDRWGEPNFNPSQLSVLRWVEHAMDSNLSCALRAVNQLKLLASSHSGVAKAVMQMLLTKRKALQSKPEVDDLWRYIREYIVSQKEVLIFASERRGSFRDRENDPLVLTRMDNRYQGGGGYKGRGYKGSGGHKGRGYKGSGGKSGRKGGTPFKGWKGGKGAKGRKGPAADSSSDSDSSSSFALSTDPALRPISRDRPPADFQAFFLDHVLASRKHQDFVDWLPHEATVWEAAIQKVGSDGLGWLPVRWLVDNAPVEVWEREVRRRVENLEVLTCTEKLEVLMFLPFAEAKPHIIALSGRDAEQRVQVAVALVECALRGSAEDVRKAVEWVVGRMGNEQQEVKLRVFHTLLDLLLENPGGHWRATMSLPQLFDIMFKTHLDVSSRVMQWVVACQADMLVYPVSDCAKEVEGKRFQETMKYHQYFVSRKGEFIFATDLLREIWQLHQNKGRGRRAPLSDALDYVCQKHLCPVYDAVVTLDKEGLKTAFLLDKREANNLGPADREWLLSKFLSAFDVVPFAWFRESPAMVALFQRAMQEAVNALPLQESAGAVLRLLERGNTFHVLSDDFVKGLVDHVVQRTQHAVWGCDKNSEACLLLVELIKTPAYNPAVARGLCKAKVKPRLAREVMSWFTVPHLNLLERVVGEVQSQVPRTSLLRSITVDSRALWSTITTSSKLWGLAQVVEGECLEPVSISRFFLYVNMLWRLGRYDCLAAAFRKALMWLRSPTANQAHGSSFINDTLTFVNAVYPAVKPRRVKRRRRYNRGLSRKMKAELRQSPGRRLETGGEVIEAVKAVFRSEWVAPSMHRNTPRVFVCETDPWYCDIIRLVRCAVERGGQTDVDKRWLDTGRFDDLFEKYIVPLPKKTKCDYLDTLQRRDWALRHWFATNRKERMRRAVEEGINGVQPRELLYTYPNLFPFAVKHAQRALMVLGEEGVREGLIAKWELKLNMFKELESTRILGGQCQRTYPHLWSLPPEVQVGLVREWGVPFAFESPSVYWNRLETEVLSIRTDFAALIASLPCGAPPVSDGRHPLTAHLQNLQNGELPPPPPPPPKSEDIEPRQGYVGRQTTEMESKSRDAAYTEEMGDALLKGLAMCDTPVEAIKVLEGQVGAGLKHKSAHIAMCSVLRCVNPELAGEVISRMLKRKLKVSARAQLCRAVIALEVPQHEALLIEHWCDAGTSNRDIRLNIACTIANSPLLRRCRDLRKLFDKVQREAEEGITDASYVLFGLIACLAGCSETPSMNMKQWPVAAPSWLAQLTTAEVVWRSPEASRAAEEALERYLQQVRVWSEGLAAEDLACLDATRVRLVELSEPSASHMLLAGRLTRLLVGEGHLSHTVHRDVAHKLVDRVDAAARSGMSDLQTAMSNLETFCCCYTRNFEVQELDGVVDELVTRGKYGMAAKALECCATPKPLALEVVTKTFARYTENLCRSRSVMQMLSLLVVLPDPPAVDDPPLVKLMAGVNNPSVALQLYSDPDPLVHDMVSHYLTNIATKRSRSPSPVARRTRLRFHVAKRTRW